MKDSIKATERASLGPLSHGQKALYALYADVRAIGDYNLGCPCRFAGTVEPALMERALRLVRSRHEMLRAGLRLEMGEPSWCDCGDVEFELVERDATSLGEKEFTAAVEAENRRPFPLLGAPFFRAVFFVRADRNVVLLTVNHIVADFVSIAALIGETWSAYQAFGCGQDPAQRPAPASFRDWVGREADFVDSGTGAAAWDYLRTELEGLTEPTRLQLGRPAGQDGAVRASVHGRLNEDQTSRLRRSARESGVTVVGQLVGLYATLARQRSGQEQVVIGTPFANRLDRGDWGLVGPLANLVPLRFDFSRLTTFREVFAATKEKMNGVWPFQMFPYPLVCERMQALGRMKEPRLVRLAISYLKASSLAQLGDTFGISAGEGQFDLTLQVMDFGNVIDLAWKYDTARLAVADVELLQASFVALLEAAAHDAGLPCRSPLHWPAAERQMLAEYNETKEEYEREKTLVELVEERVRERGGAKAVESGERWLSYEELNGRANALARRLQAAGVGREQRVGVWVERSVEMVVAVLAVLKAGGAYLPLDRESPPERVRMILTEAEAKWVVVNRGTPLDDYTGQRFEVEDETLYAMERSDLPRQAGPEDLAYVIYTSGSTGRPKGAMLEHRGVVNTLLDVNRRFQVGPQDRVLALSSLAFDLSVYDIFGTLAAGGVVEVVSEADRRAPERWLEIVSGQGVTVWDSVPALMQLLVEEAEREKRGLGGLRLVLLSGDWIPVSLPDRIRAVQPGAQVIGMGGATEASIWSIIYPIGEVPAHWPSIPYGRPMANQTYHVLNEQGESCPIGVAGELYIGGEGLARGYWKDEQKTAASFIKHRGQRLYRTGDLGRHLPDGPIEFLGRNDFQVKVRGHRIELGEIEAALLKCAGVKQAVVTAHGEGTEKTLCAYVVGEAQNLRESLSRSLPDYMVPAHYVSVASLPLNANGKVDRKALPAPSPVSRPDYAPPRNALEQALVEIWQEVLGVERVGIHDDFFTLGGHSLKAVRLVSLTQKRLGLPLSIHSLFQRTSVAKVAEYLQLQLTSAEVTTEVKVPGDEEVGAL